MKEIGVEDARRLLEDDQAVVLDGRSPEAYARRHLPGALNVPADAADVAERVRTAAPDPGTVIVAYGSQAEVPTAPRLASLLERMGYTNVHELRGGLDAWVGAGRLVEGGSRPPRRHTGRPTEPAWRERPAPPGT
jgi:rhodanese-related sulfurtransferase